MIRAVPLFVAVALALSGAPATAAVPDPPQAAAGGAAAKRIDIEFRGTLADAIEEIGKKGGINVFGAGDLSQSAVVRLKDVTAEEALQAVAEAYDLRIQKSGNIWTLRPAALGAGARAGAGAGTARDEARTIRKEARRIREEARKQLDEATRPASPPTPGPMEGIPVPAVPPVPPVPPVPEVPDIPEITGDMGEEQLDQVMRLAEEAAEKAEDEADEIIERVTDQADAIVEDARDELEAAQERGNDEAIALYERSLEQAEEAREHAREQAQAARERAREIRQEAREAMREAREKLRELSGNGRNAKMGFTGPIHVKEGEVVEDVVAYGGPVQIDGHVLNDVVSFGGPITLGPKAWVEGDVISFGGPITQHPEAVVDGEVNSLGGPIIGGAIGRGIAAAADPSRERRDHEWNPFAITVIWFIVLFAIGFLAALLIPRRMKLVQEEIRANPLKAALAGLLGALAVLPLTILLLVTLIGIPVAAALWLLVPLAMAVGFTAVANEIGLRLPVFRGHKTRALVLALGLVLLLVVANIPVIGPLSIFALLLIGFGAIVRTRFGTRPSGPRAPPPPAEPTSTDIPSGVPV